MRAKILFLILSSLGQISRYVHLSIESLPFLHKSLISNFKKLLIYLHHRIGGGLETDLE
jgi:hypothetical protein